MGGGRHGQEAGGVSGFCCNECEDFCILFQVQRVLDEVLSHYIPAGSHMGTCDMHACKGPVSGRHFFSFTLAFISKQHF